MKRNVFALIFSVILILSCLLASCNANQKIFDDSDDTKDTTASTNENDYEEALRDLENQILALQQNQSQNDQKNQQELERLQALLEQLKNEQKKPSGEHDGKESDKEDSDSNNDISDTVDTDGGENENENNQNQSQATAKFLYTIDGNSATITGYTGEGKTLVIPSMIDGYYVLAIADNAFEGTKFEKVIVSSGIVKIGWFAFRNCSALKSVTLPASVEQIGYAAFSGTPGGLTFYVSSGSFAARYAQSYGYSYVTV